MRIRHLLMAVASAALCVPAFAGGLGIYPYPAMIRDDGLTTLYREYNSDLMFLFYNTDGKVTTDVSQSTEFYLELPEGVVPLEASVMNRWKQPNSITTEFPSEEASERDGMKYRRYRLPLPDSAIQPVISKPLPGGMFGGTPNNLVQLSVRGKENSPEKFRIFYELKGKYAAAGSFPACFETLPPAPEKPLRTILRGCAPLPNLGNTDAMIENTAKIYRRLGITSVDAQFPSGPNVGRKEIWQKAGFRFYGGNSLMHVLIYHDRNASDDIRDYLVGLDGERTKGSDPRAYHSRLWCAEAAVRPGAFPQKLFLERMAVEVESGISDLDIDLEVHTFNQCFCPDCRAAFRAFTGKDDSGLSPLELVRKYPLEWYKFRNEQTRRVYAMLREKFPNVRVGANTILHHFENDLGDLKYGMCDFAEDPRLLNESIDYVLADTLVGGVYDGISVDAMHKSFSKPIITVPGTSYCVGYDWGVMPARRMTAEMTGESYGYECRNDFMTLGILHQTASGAAGLRASFPDASDAAAFLRGVKVLEQVEDFYLDGKRRDELLSVADVTKGISKWESDKSRVRGGVWKYYYDNFNGRVQYRVHELNGKYLVSLFNWDPFQRKTWHLSWKDLPANIRSIRVLSGAEILPAGKNAWSAEELKTGFSWKIPAGGYSILELSPETAACAEKVFVKPEATRTRPYNQNAWRTGGQIDMGAVLEEALKRPLNQLEQYGTKHQKGDAK